MIVDNANNFITALASNTYPSDSPATPKAVLMVEPEGFYVGEETALDNHYIDLADSADPERAVRQFHDLVALIRSCGTEVLVFPGSVRTPDDVFPNNVFATVPGRLVIGNMRYPIRQLEAERKDIPAFFYPARLRHHRSQDEELCGRTDRRIDHGPGPPDWVLRHQRTSGPGRRRGHARSLRPEAHLLL